MATATVIAGYELDALIAHGAAANQRAFPGPQKKYMHACGVGKSTASRHLKGDVHAPSTHLLVDAARAAAEGGNASAYPYVSEVIATVNQHQIKLADTAVLRARLTVLDETEHAREHSQNLQKERVVRAPTPEQLEAGAAADIAHAETLLERASIQRELAERQRRGWS